MATTTCCAVDVANEPSGGLATSAAATTNVPSANSPLCQRGHSSPRSRSCAAPLRYPTVAATATAAIIHSTGDDRGHHSLDRSRPDAGCLAVMLHTDHG